jgi:hypothetical protein
MAAESSNSPAADGDAVLAAGDAASAETLVETAADTQPPAPRDVLSSVGFAAGREAEVLVEGRALLQGDAAARAVQVHERLARGGMGEVLLATQPALRRTVAVKRAASPRNLQAVAAVLREAWIAAWLDHPHILPVHDLVQDGGEPLLVMKRIEGAVWSAKIGRDGTSLDQQIPVFLQVCDALRYAHARGVVHLDIKPDNIMVGEFGEVYLLDWGLAAAFRGDAPPWMPRSAQIDRVVGTPLFMAPEQAAAAGHLLGPATDIYQLGALLYLLGSGQPPRRGSLAEVLAAARGGTLPDLDLLPPALRPVCARAMAAAPAERYPDVAALAAAVVQVQRYRNADQLTAEGLERLRLLRHGEVEPQRAERVATESAFAFDQALGIWPDSPEALAGRMALVHWQVRHDLDRGAAELAAARLAVLDEPPADLRADVDAALARARTVQADAEALRRQHDQESGRSARARSMALLGVLFLGWHLTFGYLDRHVVPIRFGTLHATSVFALAAFGLGVWLMRSRLPQTVFNRTVLYCLGAAFVWAPFYWLCCQGLGLSARQALALSVCIYALFTATMAAAIEPRLRWTALAILPIGLAAARWPAYAHDFSGLVTVLMGWTLTWLWQRPKAATANPR